MLDHAPSPQDYMLRVAADEIEFLEAENLRHDYPHVAKFLQHPFGLLILQHVQNFCWTVERLSRRLRQAWAPRTRPRGAGYRVDLDRPDDGERDGLRPLRPGLSDSPVRPNVWIDVTNTHRNGFSGGIERVALKLADAAFETGLALPVLIEDGDVFEYTGRARHGSRLRFTPGVIYVIADSFWQQIDEYGPVCDRATAAGSKVVVCIHDVIPLYYPTFNRVDFAQSFARAFKDIIERCDACIVSSNYSREKVRIAIKTMRLRIGRPLPLTHFLLGADGHVCDEPLRIRETVRDLFARDHVFLSVGTLEPRKGYAVTLDAFDRLWRQGINCSFVIIGRPGWISKALEHRIRKHPCYGQRLHWLDDASDAELTFAYPNAYCLLQASITEGFGLPIVEANLEGTPVIATANDIFRELGGDAITYFRTCDGVDLAETIAAAIIARPPVGRLNSLQWDQSLAQMVARISDVLEQRQAA